jgi:hypothetical protein
VPTISTILLSADAWKSASMATSATCDSNGCESVFHQITTVCGGRGHAKSAPGERGPYQVATDFAPDFAICSEERVRSLRHNASGGWLVAQATRANYRKIETCASPRSAVRTVVAREGRDKSVQTWAYPISEDTLQPLSWMPTRHRTPGEPCSSRCPSACSPRRL